METTLRAYSFNRDITINDSLDNIIDLATSDVLAASLTQRQKPGIVRTCVTVAIFNLVCSAKRKSRMPISYSRNVNNYIARDPNNVNHISKKIIEVIDMMEMTGWIRAKKSGFHHPDDPSKSFRSTMKPGEKILEAIDKPGFTFTTPPNAEGSKPYQPLILRDAKKESLDFEDTPETLRMKANLEYINAQIATYDVEILADENTQGLLQWRAGKMDSDLKGVPFEELYFNWNADKIRLYRVFNHGSFDAGGRFYGHWIQDVWAKKCPVRRHIHINGMPTVELDFSNLHIHMLYQRAGLELPPGDLYQIDIEDYADHRDTIVKTCLNTMINMSKGSEGQGRARSINAATDECYGYKHDAVGKPIITDIIDKLLVKHAAIKHLFFTGDAVSLQRMDSDIVELVLLDLMRRGIQVLSIHDSFVVPKQHAGDLEEAMKKAYRAVAGGEPPRIKRS